MFNKSLIARLAFAAVAISLSACNVAESFKETQAQSDTVAVQLEKALGAKPMVGWNIHNNDLASVNVVFESEQVSHMTIAQLQPVVQRAVAAGFKKQPRLLLIGVQVLSQ